MPRLITDNWGANASATDVADGTSLERTGGMINKGTLLRLVVAVSAFASLASLAGGFFDGH